MSLFRISPLYLLSALAALFPYFRVGLFEGYNQPYTLFIPALAYLVHGKRIFESIGKQTASVLLILAIPSIFIFLFTSDSFQSYKYLFACVSPLFLVPVFKATFQQTSSRIALLLRISLYLWTLMGALQLVSGSQIISLVVSPEVGIDIAASNRGVLSFAPEPTHYAFTAIIIAATLSIFARVSALDLLACLASAVFFAQSSSAVLVFVLSCLLLVTGWLSSILMKAVRQSKFSKRQLQQIIIASLGIVAFSLFIFLFLSESRIAALVGSSYQLARDTGYGSVSLAQSTAGFDFSVLARLNGIFLSTKLILTHLFFPFGFSHLTWTSYAEQSIYYPAISLVGPSSGYLTLLYLAGFFAVPFFVEYFKAVINNLLTMSFLQQFLVLSSVVVFVFQFSVSTPIFSLFYAALLVRVSPRLNGSEA
jgi:hypothetical protein